MGPDRFNSILKQFHQLCRKTIPPVYFLCALVLMLILGYYLPVSHLVYIPLRIFGVLLAVSGLVISSWSVALFKKAGTPLRPFDRPVAFVRDGPYQFSRNPVYLGMLLMLAGIWIALGTFTPLLVLLLFFYIIQEVFVKQEEVFLQEHLGEEYREYCQSVRRWL
ncbi:MAG TPA: isoprenylcysteine carboxylmethyltransferase family protein [Gammaproteobacteria bacterium]|nr:isoprenylcysteine carboxylmethyltransferase family protein [Gammaproteobacteria bacterium]